ncbi:MAG: hypothetical protein ACI9ND_002078 [Yoonia sp.]|jgi:hypothetical protein
MSSKLALFLPHLSGSKRWGKMDFEEGTMMVKSTKTLLRALTYFAFLGAAPLSAVAQQSSMDSPILIDVFQDGSLYITYDEYLDRQRRVLQAQGTGQVVAPLAAPTRPIGAPNQPTRNTITMSLQDQWLIGAFR